MARAKYEINNQKPILLLFVSSKVFERVVHNRIYIYFEFFDSVYRINLVFEKNVALLMRHCRINGNRPQQPQLSSSHTSY